MTPIIDLPDDATPMALRHLDHAPRNTPPHQHAPALGDAPCRGQRMDRPWGNYETLDLGARFQVKRITVVPGGRLSLQSHHHRAEHWTVVSGSATVTVDDRRDLLGENASVYIPLGAVHRLENEGKVPLVLIEVQTGPYLGEDDIVRYDDIYGRAPAEQASAA